MTVQQNSATNVVPTSAPTAGRRLPLAAGALAVSSLVIAALVLWAPWGKRNAWSYADVAPHRDAAWNALVVDAVAFVGIAVSLAVVTCLLTPARGRVWGSVGAVVAIVGGALAAAGELSLATVFWYATSAGLSKQDGTALLVWAHHHSGHTYGADAAGFVLFTLGSIVLAVALIRSRAVPVAAPIAFIVLTAAQFATTGRLADVVDAGTMLSLTAIAGLALRAGDNPGR
jgi:hypothetical protein